MINGIKKENKKMENKIDKLENMNKKNSSLITNISSNENEETEISVLKRREEELYSKIVSYKSKN